MKNISDESEEYLYAVKNIRQVSVVGLNHSIYLVSSYKGDTISYLSKKAIALLSEFQQVEINGES